MELDVRLVRKDLFASVALLIIAALYYAATTNIPTTTLSDDIGPRGLPAVLSILLAVLALALGGRALLAPNAAVAADSEKEREASPSRALGLLGLGALYISGAYAFGYVAAIVFLIGVVAIYEGAKPSLRLIAVAAGGGAVFWLLFVQVLGIPQPEGFLLQRVLP